jgi:hypothetical protein
MKQRKGPAFDPRILEQELGDLDEIADRMRIAHFGLARPLLAMRRAQAEREAARVARRKGENHPEVQARRVAAARMEARLAAFDQDLERARLDPPVLRTEGGAGIWGRVVDESLPVAEATVLVASGGKRLAFTCTGPQGGFALELPAGEGLVLSVRLKGGEEAYRDAIPFALRPGQKLFREIDLAGPAPRPCPEPPDDDGDDDGQAPPRVAVPGLVGLPEPRALALLEQAGLRLGERREEPVTSQPGHVLAQDPPAGTLVRTGSAVAIVVGVPGKPRVVPQVAEMAEADLRGRDIAAGQPEGYLASRLELAGIEDLDGLETFLSSDRHELRYALGLRTLAETDRATAALRRASRCVAPDR